MSFVFLPNTLGDAATGFGGNAVPGVATGYSALDGITGPRSTRVRFQAYNGPRNFGYFLTSASFSYTHTVIARADWMVTRTGVRIRPLQCTLNSPISYTFVSGSDFNTLNSSHLVGVRSQDLVMLTTVTNQYGGGFQWQSTASEAQQYSKLYLSNAVNIGEPDLFPFPEWQIFPDTEKRYFTPIRGTRPYQVEAQITLTWRNLTKAQVASFKSIPRLLEWPLFLYDVDGDYWNWKLEHVVVAGWEESAQQGDLTTLQVTFMRLKHYA